jgi:hypothetical protein
MGNKFTVVQQGTQGGTVYGVPRPMVQRSAEPARLQRTDSRHALAQARIAEIARQMQRDGRAVTPETIMAALVERHEHGAIRNLAEVAGVLALLGFEIAAPAPAAPHVVKLAR